jgi:hypothetical protein
MGWLGRCSAGLLPIVAFLGASGCASTNPPRLATCNGKHLRDVNIYGSVLPGAPAAASGAPGAPPPPQSTTGARADGKAERLASLRPCGGRG